MSKLIWIEEVLPEDAYYEDRDEIEKTVRRGVIDITRTDSCGLSLIPISDNFQDTYFCFACVKAWYI